MKNTAYKMLPLICAIPFAFATVACGDGDKITAENVTKEECEDLFSEVEEPAATEDAEDESSEEMVDGDYDGDGEATEDDEAIAKKCEELLADDAADEGMDAVDDAASDEDAAP